VRLAGAELSAAGRQYVDTALRRIDELSVEIEPLRTQLVNFARRQRGCQALQRHYGRSPPHRTPEPTTIAAERSVAGVVAEPALKGCQSTTNCRFGE
jgi:hypothetical protein